MSRSNSTLALLAVAAATLLGIMLARSIPSAVFPELVFNRAIVLADSGELPREQMLVEVTRPIEEAAYGVPGTAWVRSTTTRGSSEVDVTFVEGADPTVAYSLLNAALGGVHSRLPAGTSVDSRLLTTGTFPIVDVSLSSRVRSLPELTDVAFYDLVPAFHRIPGVYRVEIVGGKYREFVVRLDPARMLSHRLSPEQVVAGLARANVIASAGRVLDEHRMLLAVVTTNLSQVRDLMAVPVGELDGQPTHVRDIGTVELGIREDYIRTASERGASVLVGISRQSAGSTELIAARARGIVADLRRRYPDVDFSFSYDQSTLVRESFGSVRDAIVLGLVFSVAVVLGFTLSPLSALIAAVVVPCTIAITLVVMKAAGLTFNMMTLGGLAAGIGLFIDDAIVMVEAMHRARAAGRPSGSVAAEALGELRLPLIAATFTVIVTFAPLVFLSGVTGTFFRALATTLGAGLFISLLLALYFTPALELAVERLRGASRPPGRLFGAIRSLYLACLRPFIRLPSLALFAAMAAMAAALALFYAVGTDYLPALDEGGFILDYLTPAQGTLADTEALLEKIQNVLKSTPEVVAFSRRTGTQLGFFLTESNRGDMSVMLKRQRKRDIDTVMDSVRKRILATVPGVHIEFSQVLQDFIGDLSGTPEPVEVKIFGADQATIESTARAVAGILRTIPGFVDVFEGIVLSNPEEEVLVDGTAAERYRLSAEDVRATLRSVVEGTVATSVRVGDRLFGVRVRYPDDFHRDLSLLGQVLVHGPDGGTVPLSSVTVLRSLGERSELNRERLRPVTRVTSRLSGIDLGTAMDRVRARLRNFPLPAGITLEYGGLYADQQRAFRGLEIVLGVATVAMFLVLVWEFGRLAPALAVLAGALSCLAGSFIGLRLTDISLNISSFMGVIMVAGITAKNGILLLDRAEREVARRVAPRDALIEAAEIRLRPILMTTLATAAGLLPLALGIGAGAKVQQPLAIAVIGGLIFALLLSTPLASGVYLMGTRSRDASAPPGLGEG